ncbi:hypothetical protein JW998_14580 [candidate division KSB1 bacterium]|nr:hypothetical protein [candidate division KSB1 bacterium]
MGNNGFIRFFAYIIVLLLFMMNTGYPQNFSAGLLAGSSGGPAIQVQGSVQELAQGFPFILKFAINYATLDPGDPIKVRKIFINDATNGVPEKNGQVWDFRLDFLYQMNWFSWQRFYFYGGTRLSYFKGNFKYIGGNEDFDIKSKQWGLGVGLEKFYPMSDKIDLVLTAGLDYYKESTLTGHDTSYSPNGENVNGRKEYTYADADKAVRQPEFVPRALIGVNYNF